MRITTIGIPGLKGPKSPFTYNISKIKQYGDQVKSFSTETGHNFNQFGFCKKFKNIWLKVFKVHIRNIFSFGALFKILLIPLKESIDILKKLHFCCVVKEEYKIKGD